jgi:hypothetical protein
VLFSYSEPSLSALLLGLLSMEVQVAYCVKAPG